MVCRPHGRAVHLDLCRLWPSPITSFLIGGLIPRLNRFFFTRQPTPVSNKTDTWIWVPLPPTVTIFRVFLEWQDLHKAIRFSVLWLPPFDKGRMWWTSCAASGCLDSDIPHTKDVHGYIDTIRFHARPYRLLDAGHVRTCRDLFTLMLDYFMRRVYHKCILSALFDSAFKIYIIFPLLIDNCPWRVYTEYNRTPRTSQRCAPGETIFLSGRFT